MCVSACSIWHWRTVTSPPRPIGPMPVSFRSSSSSSSSAATIGSGVRVPIGTRNPDPRVAALEAELLELLNETGIGPMGLGGDVTVLQCHIEHADTHMTLNPVAVNYQCWAARRASAHIAADGTIDYDREF